MAFFLNIFSSKTLFRSLASVFSLSILVIDTLQLTGKAIPLASAPSIIAQGTSCIEANQSEYFYGLYKVGWQLEGLYYQSALEMKGNWGLMVTSYFNPRSRKNTKVLQTMTVYSYSFGLVIAGTNPRDPYNGRSYSNFYIPDNLIIRRQPDGELIILNCDSRGRCSAATFEAIR